MFLKFGHWWRWETGPIFAARGCHGWKKKRTVGGGWTAEKVRVIVECPEWAMLANRIGEGNVEGGDAKTLGRNARRVGRHVGCIRGGGGRLAERERAKAVAFGRARPCQRRDFFAGRWRGQPDSWLHLLIKSAGSGGAVGKNGKWENCSPCIEPGAMIGDPNLHLQRLVDVAGRDHFGGETLFSPRSTAAYGGTRRGHLPMQRKKKKKRHGPPEQFEASVRCLVG